MPGQLADTPTTKEKIQKRIKLCIVQGQNYGNKRYVTKQYVGTHKNARVFMHKPPG